MPEQVTPAPPPAAGPALDVEIQRVVFGTTQVYCRYGESWTDEQAFYIPSGKPWRTHHIDALPVLKYSEDIRAAWTIVEHFRARGWLVTVKDMPPGFPFILGDLVDGMHVHRRAICDMQWMALSTTADCQRRIYRHPHGTGDTPAEAICRAALEAVDAESEVTPEEIRAAWAPKERSVGP